MSVATIEIASAMRVQEIAKA
jgi:uncharacterized membrane protein HdeD (DUF308 family)